jgi:hypothetical protein
MTSPRAAPDVAIYPSGGVAEAAPGGRKCSYAVFSQTGSIDASLASAFRSTEIALLDYAFDLSCSGHPRTSGVDSKVRESVRAG